MKLGMDNFDNWLISLDRVTIYDYCWFLIVQVEAANKDGNSVDIAYNLLSASDDGMDKFEINSESGEITLKDTVNADVVFEYILFVEAQDRRTEIIR